MANPELGAKQICPSCSAKFYDLTRRPAHCPKCGTDFDPEEALRNRRVRVRPLAAEEDDTEVVAAPAKSESEDGFEAEPDEAPELDAGVNDAPLLADEDGAEEEAAGAPGEALGVDFAEEDEVEAADDDEVPFIDDDEDDEFSEDQIDGLPSEGSAEDR
ncbi:MAG TPA: TIGR02300 family protein [Caulobacteraceae bacterium]